MFSLVTILSCSHSVNEKQTLNVLADTGISESIVEPHPFPARMWRLTATHYRNSINDILGVDYQGQLPVDYDLHGYINVGAAEVSIAPYDFELYEQAAWEIAQEYIPDAPTRIQKMHCEVLPTPIDVALETDELDLDCLESWIVPLLTQLWRRPVLEEEVLEYMTLFEGLVETTSPILAAQGVVASGLMVPDFLYRIEMAKTDSTAEHFSLSDYEVASRLSFFLGNSSPDALLLASAAAGELNDPDIIEAHARRLLIAERANESLTSFFEQTLDLNRIIEMDKNEALFPEDTPSLRQDMINELESLFLSVAHEGDFRSLLTTNSSYLSPELAQFYGVEGVTEAGWYSLPDDHGRGGLLGRAGFLALNATALRTSPTHRGKFIRTRLLCQDIPPPPEGVVASLDGVDPNSTLREQLEQHMADPACNGCHALMDPLGFPFENFNALGGYQEYDNGFVVDATGNLDGTPVDGAAEMGQAISLHDRFPYCMTAQLMRHAVGTLEGSHQEAYVDSLLGDFAGSGYQFEELIVALVRSEAFHGSTGSMNGQACDDPSLIRPCETACGVGEEQCIDGLWQNCNAIPPATESCDGLDQDCDGITDALLQSCSDELLFGVQSCTSGDWSPCVFPHNVEVCDGIDNDGNGEIDDTLAIEIATVELSALQAEHYGCDPLSSEVSGPCNAAINRLCSARACDSISGFGILAFDAFEEKSSIACLDETIVTIKHTTFEELASYHSYCLESEPVGADCNASIHRYCSGQGLSSGFGPLEHAAGSAVVACTPTAQPLSVNYDVLNAYQADCHWPVNRYTIACNTAIHNWCQDEGYATGFGPVENSDNYAWVSCIPWPGEQE